jgi:hypothetical protein
MNDLDILARILKIIALIIFKIGDIFMFFLINYICVFRNNSTYE